MAKLFDIGLPQIQDIAVEAPSGLGGLAGVTALSMLALGALLASPAPGPLRRSGTDDRSFFDVLSNLWNGDDEPQEDVNPYRRTYDAQTFFDEQYGPGSLERNSDRNYYRRNDNTYNDKYDKGYQSERYDYSNFGSQYDPFESTFLEDDYYKKAESKRYDSQNYEKSKGNSWFFNNDEDTSYADYEEPELSRREGDPYSYVTVEQVNRIADESLSDILKHYENVARKTNRNQEKPATTKEVHQIEASPAYSRLYNSPTDWNPVHVYEETDWYPVHGDPLLKNHKIKPSDVSQYETVNLQQDDSTSYIEEGSFGHALEEDQRKFQQNYQRRYGKSIQ